MTNEALEEEIVPIMNEFKVLVQPLVIQTLTNASLGIPGSRNVCRMFSQTSSERVGGVLLRAKSCLASDSPFIRLQRSCVFGMLPFILFVLITFET